jgi:hypothetical protein
VKGLVTSEGGRAAPGGAASASSTRGSEHGQDFAADFAHRHVEGSSFHVGCANFKPPAIGRLQSCTFGRRSRRSKDGWRIVSYLRQRSRARVFAWAPWATTKCCEQCSLAPLGHQQRDCAYFGRQRPAPSGRARSDHPRHTFQPPALSWEAEGADGCFEGHATVLRDFACFGR